MANNEPRKEYFTRASKSELNRQNLLIAVAYELTNFALLELMKLNITVLSVTIEGVTPRIEVLDSKGCRALESHVFATISHAGERIQKKRAVFKSCLIEWERNVVIEASDPNKLRGCHYAKAH